MYFFPTSGSILEETCHVITAAHCFHVKSTKVYNVMLSYSQNTTARFYLQNMGMYSEQHIAFISNPKKVNDVTISYHPNLTMRVHLPNVVTFWQLHTAYKCKSILVETWHIITAAHCFTL
jgi:hypothetical protein